ncbi:MAG: LamG domain-containing protein [Armatimonadota bacterium]|nr:LamG domain-containing protein [Armatimonadota bacterium]
MRSSVRTAVLALAMLCSFSALTAAEGLVAHWRMEGIEDGAVADATGNGHHATAHGLDGELPEVVEGIAGNALRFHRDLEQYLLVESSEDLAAPESLTVMAWIRPAMRKGAHGIIGNKSDKSGDPPWPGWRFRYFWARIIFQYGTADGREPTVSSENWSVMPGFWHHVAAVYDGHRVRLYVNCEPAADEEVEGAIMPRERRFVIGNFVGRKNAYAFDGEIDELRIYDRALSAEEIFEAAVEGMP